MEGVFAMRDRVADLRVHLRWNRRLNIKLKDKNALDSRPKKKTGG